MLYATVVSFWPAFPEGEMLYKSNNNLKNVCRFSALFLVHAFVWPNLATFYFSRLEEEMH